MVCAVKPTPETLVSASYRSAAVPNADGTPALFTESAHETGSNTFVEIADGDGVHDANWVPGTRGELVYLKSGGQGIIQVIIASGNGSAA
ncbi:hypothetical protein J3459_017554 [Metarhizium acridum]|uniref:uncharacterized protein n=1 Tax=Metarhizium acridum TaxID=92637 RepID=UPI001C6AA166|nr:hypothetical protein J3458_019510 [Metarhizium acridum]KAG8409376.1 hypothetical protein J3459_017554 [Metarhizium acridum]